LVVGCEAIRVPSSALMDGRGKKGKPRTAREERHKGSDRQRAFSTVINPFMRPKPHETIFIHTDRAHVAF
jgi:hypothetical protein